MDLGLHLRVLLRFRALISAGLVLAVVLTLLSLARVSFAGGHLNVNYRQKAVWQGSTTLILTPHGFPWGPAVSSQSADPAVYGTLALIYSKLVTSDAVRRIMLHDGPISGKVGASYVSATPNNPSGPPLPLITVSGTGTTARGATALATRAATAFLQYFTNENQTNDVRDQKRVTIKVLNRAEEPVLLKGRSKTLPIVIFLTVMVAVCALAFALENLRPRVRLVVPSETASQSDTAASAPARPAA
jgi:hypothetical protein